VLPINPGITVRAPRETEPLSRELLRDLRWLLAASNLEQIVTRENVNHANRRLPPNERLRILNG
jgi:hypothetical protein